MKKYKIFYLFAAIILICGVKVNAQDAKGSTFLMPIALDDNLFVSSARVSFRVKEYDSFFIEKDKKNVSYSAGEEFVCQLFLAAQKGDKKKFLALSGSKDSVIELSYSIYNLFFSKAKKPRILYNAEIGPVSIFYVKTDVGLPLITIAIMKSDNHFVNAAKYVNNPIVGSLNSVLNEYLAHPNIKFKKTGVDTNMKTISIRNFQDLDTNDKMSYSLRVAKVNYNLKNVKDSSNSYPTQYKELLTFCAASRDLLGKDNKIEYLNSFTQKSKNHLQKVFDNTSASEMKYKSYKKFRLLQDRIGLVVDLGDAFIVIYKHHGNILYREFYDYVRKEGSGYRFCNAGKEFFFDDLLRRADFSNALKFN